MTTTFEIVGKFDTESDSQKLLYAPALEPQKYRETQCYHVEHEGDSGALEDFVRKVLFDPISQELRSDGKPSIAEASFVLEYGMKAGALDLEKETILSRYRLLEQPKFKLSKLLLRKRIYVFGEKSDPARFIRDVCNPAIHAWQVLKLAA